MELIFIVTIAGLIGAGIAISPLTDRRLVGAGLLIGTGIAIAVAAWVVLLLIGLPSDGWLMWVLPLALGGAAVIGEATLLARRRSMHDDALLAKLSA